MRTFMHLVPIIPRPKTGVEESLAVSGVAVIKPAKPVQERTLVLMRSFAHGQPLQMISEAARPEKAQVSRQAERRIVCRRLHHPTILEALRSSIDRRRHQQRKTDVQLHIDAEA